MTDFFVGFFFAFPTAFLIAFVIGFVYFRKTESSMAYDLTIIKEDLANLQVKLSGFLHHV